MLPPRSSLLHYVPGLSFAACPFRALSDPVPSFSLLCCHPSLHHYASCRSPSIRCCLSSPATSIHIPPLTFAASPCHYGPSVPSIAARPVPSTTIPLPYPVLPIPSHPDFPLLPIPLLPVRFRPPLSAPIQCCQSFAYRPRPLRPIPLLPVLSPSAIPLIPFPMLPIWSSQVFSPPILCCQSTAASTPSGHRSLGRLR